VIGDIITAIDGQPVEGVSDLLQQLDSRRVGDKVLVTVKRGNQSKEFALTLAERMLGSGTE
jgi:putative serine protease PepD